MRATNQEKTRTRLNFEALSNALKMQQMSLLLGGTLQSRPDAMVDLDEDEVKHVKALLDRQLELSRKVIDLEGQRVTAECEVVEAKLDLCKEFSIMSEIYSEFNAKNGSGGAAGKSAEAAEQGDNKRKKGLKADTRRLEQMKHILQKVLMEYNGADMSAEMREKCDKMLLRAGLPCEKLIAESS